MSAPTHAVTIWQPWASLIAFGFKKYEFRTWKGWPSLYGQRIAIHAGARRPRKSEIEELLDRIEDEHSFMDPKAVPYLRSMSLDSYPRGCIVATARMGDALMPWQVAELAGYGNDSDRSDHFNWAWPMEDVIALSNPQEHLAIKGAQGFWRLPGPLREDIAYAEKLNAGSV